MRQHKKIDQFKKGHTSYNMVEARISSTRDGTYLANSH